MKETDYMIIGAGAMGMAFADEIFHKDASAKLVIVDRRSAPGGHWVDAYPFVRLHQPAAFYGVNSRVLGNGTKDLSSKGEILEYYRAVMEKMVTSGRVEFLPAHNYLGDSQVAPLTEPTNITTYKVRRKLVDATYMKVAVPSTHAPKYQVDEGVPLIPINGLVDEYNKWEQYYIIGNGKTGMDAVLFLLDKGVAKDSIHWICSNQPWVFHREQLQVGNVANVLMQQLDMLRSTQSITDFFLEIEDTAGLMRIDPNKVPKKWRCATVSDQEIIQLRSISNLIEKGRVTKITPTEIQLQQGSVVYTSRSLFIDCSANGLSREEAVPIFSKEKITLQSVLLCQQVFSAACIARMELTKMNDTKKNELMPIAHPEYQEDWPFALSRSVENLLFLHKAFRMWMFKARLNFMSHEPLYKYVYYAIKAVRLSSAASKNADKLDSKNMA